MPDPSDVLLPGPWRHRDLTANGVRLHVAEQGDGPLVVLLHGFPEGWWAWRHQLPALAAAGYRAAAIDLRGYGASDKPPRGYDLFTAAADVAGIVRALGEREAVVVGHALGGLIGWAVTALHPGVVRGFAAVSAAHPRRLRREFVTSRRQRAALSFVWAHQVPRRPETALSDEDGAEVERLLRRWSGPAWRETEDFRDAARLYRTAMQVPQATYGALEYHRWAVRSLLRGDGRRFAEALRAPVRVPVLHVHGTADPVVLTPTAAGSAAYVRGTYEWLTLAGIGHFLPEEAPDALTAALTGWLDHLPGTPPSTSGAAAG